MYDQCFKPCPNKTDNGFCKTTTCINPLYSNIGTAQYGQGVQKRIVTNADKIRAMTDVELAEWLETIRMYCANDLCGMGCPFEEICYSKADAPTEMLAWLKEEASDEN